MKLKKIICIDDDKDFLDALKITLIEEGLEVIALESGEKLSEFLPANKFDLAIVDYQLPGEDGIALTQKIKKVNGTKVIMVSGKDGIGPIAKEKGVDYFFSKPLDFDKFLTTIRSL